LAINEDSNLLDQFEAIIFDMDGTLVDSGRLHEIAWINTLDAFEIPLDRPLMRSLCGVPTLQTLELLLKKFKHTVAASAEEMTLYKEAIVKEKAREHVKPTGLLELALASHGKMPMSVGTGATGEEAANLLRYCKMDHLFDHVVGAERVAKPKPAPDTFLLCAELMGIRPEACVVFEDSPLGLDAARAANMTGIDVLEAFQIENDYFL